MMVRVLHFYLFLLISSVAPVHAAGVVGDLVSSIQLGFQQPSAVAIGPAGRVYLLDGVSRQVWVLTAAGELIEKLEVMSDSSPETHLPTDLALDGHKLYIADPGGNQIWILDTETGEVVVKKPQFQGEPLQPSALLVDHSLLYFSDRLGHRVCYSDRTSFEEVVCWGEWGDAAGAFHFPYMMAKDEAGYLLVTDVLNGRVQIFHPNGNYSAKVGRFGTGAGSLYRPNGVVTMDAGQVLVSDVYQGTVSVYSGGRFLGLLVDKNGRAFEFEAPIGMAIDGNKLYLVDALNNSLEILQLAVTENPSFESPIATSSLSQKECAICHQSWVEKHFDSDPAKAHLLPVTQPSMCFSCHHGAVVESRYQLARGEQHPSLPMQSDGEWLADAGGLVDAPPGHLPIQDSGHLRCGSCHTPHKEQISGETDADIHNDWLRQSNDQSDMCHECHRKEAEMDASGQYRNHPLSVRLAAPPHQEASNYTSIESLQAGLPEKLVGHGAVMGPNSELICESCHRVHGAAGKPLLVESGSNQLCAQCHEQQYAVDDNQARHKGVHPVEMRLDEPLEVAGLEISELSCASCHEVHGEGNSELLLRGGLEPETLCQECHPHEHSESEEEARRKGVHPVGVKLDKPVEIAGKMVNEVGCLSCHSVHHGVENSAALTVSAVSGELCQICHDHAYAEDEAEATRKGVHPVNIQLSEQVEIAEKSTEVVTCLTCHSLHQGVEHSAALVQSDHEGELCENCHHPESAVKNSDHDLRQLSEESVNHLDQPFQKTALCGGCHSLHRTGDNAGQLFVGSSIESSDGDGLRRDQYCLTCHSEKGMAKEKMIETYTHPWKNLILRSNPEDYPLLNAKEKVDEFGRIACISCHDPHRWHAKEELGLADSDQIGEEGNVQSSFLRQLSPGDGFCADCHGLDTLSKYKFYHDSKSRQTVDDFDGSYIKDRFRTESVRK